MQNSVYVFEVRVNNKKTEEYEHNSEIYIEGRKGSEYELYFKNNSYNKVLVVFSVDGLSIIDGKPASEKSQGYIVDGFSEILVPGWKINSSKVAKFQFHPQNDKANTTYVELLKEEGFEVDTKNQGVIGCMVFKEKLKISYNSNYRFKNSVYLNPNNIYTSCGPQGIGITSNMSYLSRSSSFSSSVSPEFNETSLGTGFGEDKNFQTKTENFVRNENYDWIGVINYDTIQGLKSKGVILNKKPSAFPGMNNIDGCYIPIRR